MCRRAMAIGNAVMALGAGLLPALLVPRSFLTVVLGVGLLVLGWLIRK